MMRRGHKFRLLIAALTSAVVAAMPAAGGASPQTKPPPPGDASPPNSVPAEQLARIEAQRPLVDAASRIQRTVDAGADEGYAGIVIGADHITVWWKGPLPATVNASIDEVRRTTPVEVAVAAHSRAELVAAAERVTAHVRANPDGPYYGTEIRHDGSGLVVDTEQQATGLPRAMKQAAAGVPVTVRAGGQPELRGRLDDYAPYYSGGRITNNDFADYFCTAGWPVEDAYGEYMLTAGHCGRPGGTWDNGNHTRFFGTGIDESVEHDLLLIDASVAGRMWDGGVGSGEFTKGIAGSDHAFPGEWVCTSGSVTGAKCWYQVTNSFQFSYCDLDAYGNNECYYDLVLAQWFGAQPATRPGDSGGPVFVPVGPNQSQVMAKGTITGEIVGSNGDFLMFQDFITAQRDFGITVIRG